MSPVRFFARPAAASLLGSALLAASLAATPCLVACRSATAPPPASDEASVRPGINESYFKERDVEKWVERFETEDREIWHRREEIVARVGVSPGMVVADVGAGTGVFTPLFAKAVAQTGKVYAVDIMPEFLEHIRERCQASGLANVETVLCKENSVELAQDSIDLAFVCDTYHHFEYPKSTLASIREALRRDGELVVIDFIRVEGESRPWILEHVRAGKEVVIAEIRKAGFALVEDVSFLSENYFLRFRKGP